MIATLRSALAFAARGVPVLPLAGKVPLAGSGGVKDATTDEDQIRKWWRAGGTGYPAFGIATGHRLRDGGCLLVVDVDRPKAGEVGGMAAVDFLHDWGALPRTAAVVTGGGGMHFYYRCDGDVCPTIGSRMTLDDTLLSVDWRGRGGYVVAPPSLHSSGRCYRWARESKYTGGELAYAPGLLLDLLHKPAPVVPLAQPAALRIEGDKRRVAYVAKVIEEEIASLRSCAEGGRHRALARASFKIGKVVNDAERDGAESAILAAWNEVTGGKRHREGLRTIGDAIGAARRRGGSALP